jgi:hypothetical protein
MQFVCAALSSRFNSGSALCGKTTRDYTFITAHFQYRGMPPPPAIQRLWRRLIASGLSRRLNITQLPASPAPTAHRGLSMSRMAGFAAHPTPTSYMRLYRFVYNAADHSGNHSFTIQPEMRRDDPHKGSRYIAPAGDIPSFSLYLAIPVWPIPPHFGGQKILIFCSLNELPK